MISTHEEGESSGGECSDTLNIVGAAVNFSKATEKSDSKNVDTTEELQDPITICNSNDPVQFVGVRITAHVTKRIIQTGSCLM